LDEGITHFCAAPTVLIMLMNDVAAHRLQRPVRLFTAGAPPSPAVIAKMAELNFTLDHVYGLTETYGPFTINVLAPALAEYPADERARFKARQGFANVCAGEVRVVDEHMRDVPADGHTMGEVVMRGNVVMSGYYADREATDRACAGGWFHSGDIAVRHAECRQFDRSRSTSRGRSGNQTASGGTVGFEHDRVVGPSQVDVCGPARAHRAGRQGRS
jgi:fatty-acyl-CoA synthase